MIIWWTKSCILKCSLHINSFRDELLMNYNGVFCINDRWTNWQITVAIIKIGDTISPSPRLPQLPLHSVWEQSVPRSRHCSLQSCGWEKKSRCFCFCCCRCFIYTGTQRWIHPCSASSHFLKKSYRLRESLKELSAVRQYFLSSSLALF